MALTDPVTVLKGVGASRAAQLEKLGIVTLEDLIHYYPRDYEDRTKLVTLSQLTTEEPACFRAMVLSTHQLCAEGAYLHPLHHLRRYRETPHHLVQSALDEPKSGPRHGILFLRQPFRG